MDPSKHVLSDKHLISVSKLGESKNTNPAKFKFCCDSCSFLFSTLSKLTDHVNCPKLKFRCVPCNKSFHPSDFDQHLKQCQSQEAGTCNETIDLSASTAPSNIFRQPLPATTVTIGQKMSTRDQTRPPSPADDSIIV